MIELTKDEMAMINAIGKKEGCDRDGDILSFFVKEDEEYARVLSLDMNISLIPNSCRKKEIPFL